MGFTDCGNLVLISFEGGGASFEEVEEMGVADVFDPVVNSTFADSVLFCEGLNLELTIGMTRRILFEMEVHVNLFVELPEFWVVLDKGKRAKGLLIGI